jgi:bifunctional non-homologous end joining protein LigD
MRATVLLLFVAHFADAQITIDASRVPSREIKAKFIEPMLLLPAEALPEGQGWSYELKLDGYRALGIKGGGTVRLRSRNDKDFNGKYPAIARALAAMPDETVVDGEVVALDETGRPSFDALQNGATGAAIFFYVFDVMILAGRNVMGEPLRRAGIQSRARSCLCSPSRSGKHHGSTRRSRI